MKKLRMCLTLTLLLGALLALPAAAQIQYFGYVGGADDDASLAKTKGYTNFAHLGASDNLYDSFIVNRVNALSQRGMKATIDLGKVLWCDYDASGLYRDLCWDWSQRWTTWKAQNASILTSSKVIALVVRDEPFNYNVNMYDFEVAAARVKADLPWVKIWMVEAACVVYGDSCGWFPGAGAFARYTGTLPNIDWVGLDNYAIHPATDWTLNQARSRMKTKFPGKKWLYVMDGWWDYGNAHGAAFSPNGLPYMATIAREWYDYARADADAVILGVFIWPTFGEGAGSMDLPCNVLAEHASIGRAITGKTRGTAPIGSFSVDSNGLVSGWTCDPDQTACEQVPTVKVFIDGVQNASFYPPGTDNFTNLQCGTETAYRYKYTLPRSSAGKTVTVTNTDTDSAGAQIASTCAQSPACSWTPHLQYFGYVGSGDDAQNQGLDQTKGFTNFSHISTAADLASTFVRDRVTVMSQKGIKATIDLGLVLWCGAPTYRNLCPDWAARWETWKTNNASILTSDKVLAFAILDEPFNRKTWMVEAACVIYGDNCGFYPGGGAYAAYTGTLPNIDWIGIDSYGIHPNTDITFQRARTRLKGKFPGRKWVYIMDGYWDANHSAVASSANRMDSIAREWHDAARNDFDSILLGVFTWAPLSGTTTSRDFSCTVLSAHRDIGREVTGKTRAQTGLPIGRLESVTSGSGIVSGYACDPDGTICEDPKIDLYSDASFYGTVINYPYRNSYVVNAQCGVGVAYRFQTTLSQSASGHKITAYAKDLDAGGTTLPSNCADNPSCLWYSTSYQPKGYMETISSTGVTSGWVCDPDAPHISTKVRLALSDGTPIGTFPTNLNSEQAVANECGGGTVHRFSTQLPTWARYQEIHAYSQDLVSGEAEIPWLCDGGWYCIWF
jgi:hypothetical protein